MSLTAVQFNEDGGGSIALVCSTWLTPLKREVFWPPVKSQIKLNDLLTQGKEPDHDKWNLYPITRCFFTDDNYEKACKKLKLLEDTSDVQTETDEGDKKKRKRVAKRISSDYDYSTDDDVLPPPPKILTTTRDTGHDLHGLSSKSCSLESPLSQTGQSASTPSTPKSSSGYHRSTLSLGYSNNSQAPSNLRSPMPVLIVEN